MKIKYRRPDKSDYSTRAARAEAKMELLDEFERRAS